MNVMRMKKRSRLGFTLVELIVVIAILAILAGVAIPVYSGYIKKASRAADEQLLGALNTAFAAACLENRFSHRDVLDGAKLKITQDNGKFFFDGFENIKVPAGKVLSAKQSSFGFSMLSSLSDESESDTETTIDMTAKVNEAFKDRYFTGNETQALKFYKSADDFEFKDGGFHGKGTVSASGSATLKGTVDNGNGTKTYTFELADGSPVEFTISDEAVAAIQASTFGTNMEMTELLDDVSGMVESLESALNSGGLMKTILKFQGYTLEDLGISEDDPNYKEELSNAVVLMVAKNTNVDALNNVKAGIAYGQIDSALHLPDVDIDEDNPNWDPSKSYEENLAAEKQRAVGDNAANILKNMAGFYSVATAFASSDAAADWSIEVNGQTMNAGQYYSYVNNQIAAAAGQSGVDNYTKVQNIANAMGLLENYMYVNGNSSTLTEAYQSYVSTQIDLDIEGIVAGMESVYANDTSVISTGGISDGYNTGAVADILNAIFHGNT